MLSTFQHISRNLGIIHIIHGLFLLPHLHPAPHRSNVVILSPQLLSLLLPSQPKLLPLDVFNSSMAVISAPGLAVSHSFVLTRDKPLCTDHKSEHIISLIKSFQLLCISEKPSIIWFFLACPTFLKLP